jgi:hypothetical protein
LNVLVIAISLLDCGFVRRVGCFLLLPNPCDFPGAHAARVLRRMVDMLRS